MAKSRWLTEEDPEYKNAVATFANTTGYSESLIEKIGFSTKGNIKAIIKGHDEPVIAKKKHIVVLSKAEQKRLKKILTAWVPTINEETSSRVSGGETMIQEETIIVPVKIGCAVSNEKTPKLDVKIKMYIPFTVSEKRKEAEAELKTGISVPDEVIRKGESEIAGYVSEKISGIKKEKFSKAAEKAVKKEIFKIAGKNVNNSCISIDQNGNVKFALKAKDQYIPKQQFEIGNIDINPFFKDTIAVHFSAPLTSYKYRIPGPGFDIKMITDKINEKINDKKTVTITEKSVSDLIAGKIKKENEAFRPDPVLYGSHDYTKKKPKIKYEVLLSDPDILFFSGPLISGKVNLCTGKMIKTEKNEKLLKLEKEMKGKLHQRAVEFAKECIKKYLGTTRTVTKGAGLLYGNTTTTVTDDKLDQQKVFEIELPSYKDSLTVWRKAVESECKRINETLVKMAKDEEETLLAKHGVTLGSYLHQDVLSCIAANDYITENAVVQMLRGTKVQLNTHLNYPKNAGKYNLLTKDEISDVIDDLCLKDAIFRKELKGTYGRFDILKMTKSGTRIRKIIGKTGVQDGSDFDLQKKLEEIENKSEKDNRDYMQLVKMAQSVTFYSIQEDRINAVLAEAPDMIMDMIKIKYKMETNKVQKKIYKRIIDN